MEALSTSRRRFARGAREHGGDGVHRIVSKRVFHDGAISIALPVPRLVGARVVAQIHHVLTDLTKADAVRENASNDQRRNLRSCPEGRATECAILFLRDGELLQPSAASSTEDAAAALSSLTMNRRRPRRR